MPKPFPQTSGTNAQTRDPQKAAFSPLCQAPVKPFHLEGGSAPLIFMARGLQGTLELGLRCAVLLQGVKTEHFRNCALFSQVLSTLNAGNFSLFDTIGETRPFCLRISRIGSSSSTPGTDKGRCSFKENIMCPSNSHSY